MMAVWNQSWHDLSRRWKSYLFLLVIVAVVAGLFNVAVANTVQGMTLYTTLSQQVNGADAWLYLAPRGARAFETGKIHLAGATHAPSLRPVVGIDVSAQGVDERGEAFAFPLRPPTFDGIKVVAGRYLSKSQPFGAVVDIGLAKEKDLHLGQRIKLTDGSRSIRVTIRGFEDNAFTMNYPNSYATVLVTSKAITALTGEVPSQLPGFLSVRVNHPAAVPILLSQWENQFKPYGYATAYDRQIINSSVQAMVGLDVAFLLAFVAFAVIAAIMMVGGMVSAATLEQTRNIGILKSLGYSRRQVRAAFVWSQVLMGLLAGIIGVALSQPLIPVAATPFAKNAGMAADVPHQSLIWVCVLGAMLVIIASTTHFACLRGTRIAPVQAMFHGAERPTRFGFGVLRFLAKFRLPFAVAIGLRELLVRPLKSITVLIVTMFALCAVVLSLIMVSTIGSYENDPLRFGAFSDVQVQPVAALSPAALRKDMARLHGVRYYVTTEFSEHVQLLKKSLTYRLSAESSSNGVLPYIIQTGHSLERPGDVIAGAGLLNALGLHVGDSLFTVIDGQKAHLHIVGQYFDISNGGMEAVISPQTLRQYHQPALIEEVDVNLTDPGQTPAAIQSLKSIFGAKATVVSGDVTVLPPQITQLKTLLLSFSLALVVIALLSLFNTLIRFTLERRRDIGILKSIGMSPRQAIVAILTMGMSMVLVGGVISVPLGLVLDHTVMAWAATSQGTGAIPVWIPWRDIWWIMSATVLVSVGIALVPALRSVSVRPVEVLAAE